VGFLAHKGNLTALGQKKLKPCQRDIMPHTRHVYIFIILCHIREIMNSKTGAVALAVTLLLFAGASVQDYQANAYHGFYHHIYGVYHPWWHHFWWHPWWHYRW